MRIQDCQDGSSAPADLQSDLQSAMSGNMRVDARPASRRALIVVAALLGAVLITRPYVHGLSFVVRAAEMQGARAPRRRPRHGARSAKREITIPTPARTDAGAALRAVGLAHARGAADVRASRLRASTSRGWCGSRGSSPASHIAVVTPDIPELSRFEIAPAITDAIEDAGGWLADGRRRSRRDRTAALDGDQFQRRPVGRRGRAGRRSPDRVAYVFSLGGHDDLAARAALPLHGTRAAADARRAARHGDRRRPISSCRRTTTASR